MLVNKRSIVVLSCVLVALSVFFYHKERRNKIAVLYYLPQLSSCKLYDIDFKKIHADPAFIKPYNILIKFKCDLPINVEAIGLLEQHKVDTVLLRSASWSEEYRLYFTLYSLNSTRYKSIETEEKKVTWWKIKKCTNNYVAPYFDQNNKKGIVKFGQKSNGRVACCKFDNMYYVLIECWD